MKRAATVAAFVVAMFPAAARAQPDAAPRPRSFEVYVGAIAIGPVDFGRSTARLTPNQSAARDFALFVSDTSIGTAAGFDGRVAFNITRALAVEGGFVWTHPEVQSRITSDVEGVPDATITQNLDTYFVEASALFHLNALTFAGGRGLPFVAGGAGYLRQLDDDQVLVDTGQVYHAGGGVKVFFGDNTSRRTGLIRGIGLRADGRVYFRNGGFELEEDADLRTTWSVSGGLVVRF